MEHKIVDSNKKELGYIFSSHDEDGTEWLVYQEYCPLLKDVVRKTKC